uniref:Uncharacterized protein n=1 Tax=Schistosoma haematobium TaxID=6185 RepID=A0A094ZN71_SCHHA
MHKNSPCSQTFVRFIHFDLHSKSLLFNNFPVGLKTDAFLIKGSTARFPIRGIQLLNPKMFDNLVQIGEVCFQ